MKTKTDFIDDLQTGQYKEQVQKLSTETLQIIVQEHSKALIYARKGIEVTEPENLTEDYIAIVAKGMQYFAKLILEERAK